LSFNGSGLTVNFQLRKEAGTYMRASGQLSRGNTTKYTRALLAKHRFQAETFTEKSLKVGGVTGLLDIGEPLEDVQILGGLKSLQMPLHYRQALLQFEKAVASRIP
jgi:hypothetical protein